MCGIGAVWDCGNIETSLTNILVSIKHRGDPLTSGESRVLGNLALGANRLPITTNRFLDSHRQPYKSSSGRYWLAYNGEVYGMPSQAGHDGGNLLRLVEELGVEGAFSKVNGIFGAIVFDTKTGALFLVRDHMGIKPLFYAQPRTGGLLVASEIKALSPLPSVDSIEEVPTGTVLKFQAARSKPEAVAEFHPLRQKVLPNAIDALELQSLLRDAIRVRVEGVRGPIGVFLSGGIDSGAVYVLARCFRKDIIPIIGGKKGQIDHDAALRLISEVGGRPHVVEVPSEEKLFESIPKIVYITESFEPNMIRQSAAYYHIAKGGFEAGCRVVLCGEGADELFCGYPDFQDESVKNWSRLRQEFLQDLRRTQLQRVDRIAMHFTTEVRVPFLDHRVVSAALSIVKEDQLFLRGRNRSSNKLLFRESMKGILPDWLCQRPKIVLSEGCGLRGNSPNDGMFVEHAENLVSRSLFEGLKEAYPEWNIKSREEALYFQTFSALQYTKGMFARQRPTTNQINSSRNPRHT